jgi:hypothetical protein
VVSSNKVYQAVSSIPNHYYSGLGVWSPCRLHGSSCPRKQWILYSFLITGVKVDFGAVLRSHEYQYPCKTTLSVCKGDVHMLDVVHSVLVQSKQNQIRVEYQKYRYTSLYLQS